jgi:hypothetical protein
MQGVYIHAFLSWEPNSTGGGGVHEGMRGDLALVVLF